MGWINLFNFQQLLCGWLWTEIYKFSCFLNYASVFFVLFDFDFVLFCFVFLFSGIFCYKKTSKNTFFNWVLRLNLDWQNVLNWWNCWKIFETAKFSAKLLYPEVYSCLDLKSIHQDSTLESLQPPPMFFSPASQKNTFGLLY